MDVSDTIVIGESGIIYPMKPGMYDLYRYVHGDDSNTGCIDVCMRYILKHQSLDDECQRLMQYEPFEGHHQASIMSNNILRKIRCTPRCRIGTVRDENGVCSVICIEYRILQYEAGPLSLDASDAMKAFSTLMSSINPLMNMMSSIQDHTDDRRLTPFD